MKVVGWSVTLLTGALIAITFAVIGFVIVTLSVGVTTAATTNPSLEAIDDIPAILLPRFISEAKQWVGLPWTVLAALSRVESAHTTYVADVLDWAQRYTAALDPAASPVAGHTLPIPTALVDEATLTRPHHDYPAADLPVPAGTPIFAMVDGTVATATTAGTYPTDPNRCGTTIAITGHDGAYYLYCHLSQVAVTTGQAITAETLIGLSGGQPGTPGAGNTAGPHLHLAIRINGTAICPQPLLLATYRQQPFAPATAPTTGCIDGLPITDWRATLGSS